MEQTNPFLTESELPRFSVIKAADIEPAVKSIVARNETELDALLGGEVLSGAELIARLAEMEDRLSRVWSVATHLYLVKNNDELRAVYDRCQPLVIDYNTRLSQNGALFERLNKLAASPDYRNSLSQAQRKVVEDYLLEFRLAGVALAEDKQQKFKALEQATSKLSNQFSNNVLDSTRAWHRLLKQATDLEGLPQLAIESAADAARQKDHEGFLLTLDFPSFHAVITYAADDRLRQDVYRAYTTRASDQDPLFLKWDNQTLITRILENRREMAQLLGYGDFAELSLARKMANTSDEVLAFLHRLADRGLPVARTEMESLREFAAGEGKSELQAWDIPYYSERQRKRLYDIAEEELRVYFPLEKVKAGLFAIVGQLYGISITPNSSYERWDEFVEAYDVFRDGHLIARFFFDLFTREGKQGGAWMDICRSRRQERSGQIQLPSAYLNCNFSRGTETTPPLLTHPEVTTLFHEFGHGLHHILTLEKELRISGLNGVAWDAIELPSQLMENWCWDPEGIKLISSHYKTGAALPESLLNKMLAARNFQAGMKMMRQLEFALYDFQLHLNKGELNERTSRDILTQVRKQVGVFPVPDYNRFENSFTHIYAGGYAAGYYSYYWAEVLSADVFSRFKESGIMNAGTGARFLDKLLGRGGSKKALELFVDFMGREPRVDALLHQKGLTS